MNVIYGTVKQNMIQLPEGVQLSDGTQVEIRPRQPERDSQQEKEAEMHFKEHLLKIGVLSHIAKPSSATRRKFKPVIISGPPLSEQIIADRR